MPNSYPKLSNSLNSQTNTMTNTFRYHPQRAPPETCNFWHFWSEWWGDITWLAKRQWQRQIQWKRQRQWQLKSTLKEQSLKLVTFDTLITFLTIENNNLNIHSNPWIKSDRDSIRNSCDVFIKSKNLGTINFADISTLLQAPMCPPLLLA